MTGMFDERERLIEALCVQQVVCGRREIAEELAAAVKVMPAPKGTPLITQGDLTTEMYFVFSGSVSVNINDRQISIRERKQCVGEMATVDVGVRRSATWIVREDSVVAQITQNDLLRIADAHPPLWRELARMLAERLRQRNARERFRNPRPIIFLGSSSESAVVLRELEKNLDSVLMEIRHFPPVGKHDRGA